MIATVPEGSLVDGFDQAGGSGKPKWSRTARTVRGHIQQ
jgi:hypothetical protein